MEETAVELIIDSTDETFIHEIENHFGESAVTRGRKSRAFDVGIALAVAAGVIKLINELLTLRDKWAKRENAPDITVRTVNGDSISLKDATREQLQKALSEK
jgi:hypothetical protein